MSVVRVLSSRSPYRRGGLSFDSAAVRSRDGRAVVYLTVAEARALGEANFRELVSDPAITIEVGSRAGAAAVAHKPIPAAPMAPAGGGGSADSPKAPARKSKGAPKPKPKPKPKAKPKAKAPIKADHKAPEQEPKAKPEAPIKADHKAAEPEPKGGA